LQTKLLGRSAHLPSDCQPLRLHARLVEDALTGASLGRWIRFLQPRLPLIEPAGQLALPLGKLPRLTAIGSRKIGGHRQSP
jgi:hypothetical protein